MKQAVVLAEFSGCGCLPMLSLVDYAETKKLGHWFRLAWAARNYLYEQLVPNVGIDSKIKE